MNTQQTHKLKAINSDHDTCEICGKTNLKKVMWIAELDADGTEMEPFAAGTTCGAKILGVKTTGGIKRVSIRIKELAFEQISAAKYALYENRELFWLYRNTYLPKECVIQMRIGQMDMKQALEIRAEQYPITTFFPYCEHMTTDEALSLI